MMKKLKNVFGIFGHKSKLTNVGSAKNELSHQYEEHPPSKGYQCPMKCEGGKVYESLVNCPICNMELVPVGTVKSGGHHHHGCCH